jgi:hypothetical protein
MPETEQLTEDWNKLYDRMSDILNGKEEGIFKESALPDKHCAPVHAIIEEVNHDCKDLALSMVARGESPVVAMNTAVCVALETMFYLGYQIAQEGHEIKWCSCEQRANA